MQFIVNIEEGYAPSVKCLDEQFQDLSTINLGAANYHAKMAWNKALLKDSFQYQLWSEGHPTVTCIKADLPVKFVVEKNYNGYCVVLKELSEPEGVISIDEFRVWNNSHQATYDYENKTWIYMPK